MSYEQYGRTPTNFAYYMISLSNRFRGYDMYVTPKLLARFLDEFRTWDIWPPQFSYTVEYQHTGKPTSCFIRIGDEVSSVERIFAGLELQLADLLGRMNKEKTDDA